MSLSSDINTYFDTVITSVDPSVKKWGGKFDIDNIPRNIHDKSYHVEIGDLTSNAPLNNFLDDSLEVTVSLFHKASRNMENARNSAIDLAQLIRVEAQKPVKGQNIKRVVLTRLGPENIVGDDFSVIVNMTFDIRLIYNF